MLCPSRLVTRSLIDSLSSWTFCKAPLAHFQWDRPTATWFWCLRQTRHMCLAQMICSNTLKNLSIKYKIFGYFTLSFNLKLFLWGRMKICSIIVLISSYNERITNNSTYLFMSPFKPSKQMDVYSNLKIIAFRFYWLMYVSNDISLKQYTDDTLILLDTSGLSSFRIRWIWG